MEKLLILTFIYFIVSPAAISQRFDDADPQQIYMWNYVIGPRNLVYHDTLEIDTVFDNQRIVQLKVRYPDHLQISTWSYYPSGKIMDYKISADSVVYYYRAYNEDGRLNEYYRSDGGKEIHWFFKYQHPNEREDKLLRIEVYDKNMRLVAATESDTTKGYFSAKYRYEYVYSPNGLLDLVVVRNDQMDLLFSVHYFTPTGNSIIRSGTTKRIKKESARSTEFPQQAWNTSGNALYLS
jgi:hypothetical protein